LDLRFDDRARSARVQFDGAGRGLVQQAGYPGVDHDVTAQMGTSSYILAGVVGGGAFASARHGAGRLMSRHQAARSITGPELRRRLERQGIAVRGASARGLAEETPQAYKHITLVAGAAEGAGLCQPAGPMRP
jgi:tRNA-splicing ligase RtcB